MSVCVCELDMVMTHKQNIKVKRQLIQEMSGNKCMDQHN